MLPYPRSCFQSFFSQTWTIQSEILHAMPTGDWIILGRASQKLLRHFWESNTGKVCSCAHVIKAVHSYFWHSYVILGSGGSLMSGMCFYFSGGNFFWPSLGSLNSLNWHMLSGGVMEVGCWILWRVHLFWACQSYGGWAGARLSWWRLCPAAADHCSPKHRTWVGTM